MFLGRPSNMSLNDWWMHVYVMLSRVRTSKQILTYGLPPRWLFEQGPPQWVRDGISRLEQVARLSLSTINVARTRVGWEEVEVVTPNVELAASAGNSVPASPVASEVEDEAQPVDADIHNRARQQRECAGASYPHALSVDPITGEVESLKQLGIAEHLLTTSFFKREEQASVLRQSLTAFVNCAQEEASASPSVFEITDEIYGTLRSVLRDPVDLGRFLLSCVSSHSGVADSSSVQPPSEAVSASLKFFELAKSL